MPHVIQQEIREVSGHGYKRKVKTFIFPVNSAKAFVARWENDIGDGYLSFLFECERVAQEMVPLLQDQVTVLQGMLRKLEVRRKSLLLSRKNQIPCYIDQIDLFGNPFVLQVWRPTSCLTTSERIESLKRHTQVTIRGLERKQADIAQAENFLSLNPIERESISLSPQVARIIRQAGIQIPPPKALPPK